MVKFSLFLPLTFALRVKRDIAMEINSIQEAASAFLSNSSLVASHGCHCAGLGNTNIAYLGEPIDDRDRLCKLWQTSRDCIDLSGGVCQNGTSSYSFINSCDEIVDPCQRQACYVDFSFTAQINVLSNDTYKEIAILNSENECVRQTDRSSFDSCCGNSINTFAKFDSTESRCVNEMVITEDCPSGQQKNEVTNTCEACPENTYSSNSQCAPCNSNADILIIYDGSGSMTNAANDGTGRTKWEVQKDFVASFVSNFEIDSDKVRFRAIQYNENLRYDWDWEDGDSVAEITQRTNSISQFDESSCSTCSRLAKAYRNFESLFENSRPDASKFVLAFADGINGVWGSGSNSVESRLSVGLEWAENNDVEIFFVRIGDRWANGMTWRDFALTESSYMETGQAGWNALEAIAPQISNKVCAAN